MSSRELETLVLGYTRGDVPDYQVSAWLMAVCGRGMSAEETLDLTEVMVASGRSLHLGQQPMPTADKHSTGGVGDKTSLVAVPLAAACGVRVGKMSGRGLGITGGTLDKLESIPGLRVEMTADQFLDQLLHAGAAIAGQSADLAPADGALYALRDVTATIASIPLIASSVMSKKLAVGARAIVLDVKCGCGAFMSNLKQAEALAAAMVDIGRRAGHATVAYVSDMEQPLGCAVGNALEIREAVESLRGAGPPDLALLAESLAAEMVHQSGAAPSLEVAREMVASARANSMGLERFRRLVEAQGGDVRAVDDPERLPRAPLERPVAAKAAGWVSAARADLIAQACVHLGAARQRKGDAIDPSVGVILKAKVGDRVERGAPLATVFAPDRDRADRAAELVSGAYEIRQTRARSRRLILRRLASEGRF